VADPAPRRGVGDLAEGLAANTSRRGLLARVSKLLFAGTAAGVAARAIKPGEAEAFHFCGHIYTTGSCPHPTGLPRIDAKGRPIAENGRPLTDPDGRPLPVATRTKVCTAVGDRFGFQPHIDGSWYRCCGGHVRKLVDCCGYHDKRINGDAALAGYCYEGRKVFCVMYFQTKVPC
jgi:hypothetical protein